MLPNTVSRILDQLSEALRIAFTANPWLLLAAFAMYYSSTLVYAVRWRIVLSRIGYRVPIRILIAGLLGGVFVNNVTPTSRAGGEFVRVAFVTYKESLPPVPVFNSVAYERIVESIPVVSLAIFALGYELYSGTLNPWLALSVVVIVVLVLIATRFLDRIVELALHKLGFGHLVDENAKVSKLFADKELLAIVLALSTLVWVLDVLRLYVISLALDWRAPLARFAIVVVIYLVLGIFGFTPGGLGIVEGGLSATLAAMGAPLGTAIGITLTERLISYASSTLVGFIAITLSGGREAWRRLRSR